MLHQLSYITREQCVEWIQNPLVNPLSKRPIKQHGPKYAEIEQTCVLKHNILISPTLSRLPPGSSKSSGPCPLRNCKTYDLKPSLVGGSSRRLRVVRKARACDHIWRVRNFYQKLNICEAPDNFVTTHTVLLPGMSNNRLYEILLSYLYIMYGNCIIPGVWYVNTIKTDVGLKGNLLLTKEVDDDEILTGFEDILEYVVSSGMPLHFMYVISNTSKQAHAMAIIFYYQDVPGKPKALMVSVLDPNMQHTGSAFVDAVRRMLSFQKNVVASQDFTIVENFVDTASLSQFQAANAQVEISSIDPGGYCGVWVLMMMELMAHTFATTYEKDPAKLLFIGIPPEPHEVWRKMIIDYFFTRLLDAYACATLLNRTRIQDLVRIHVVDKYTDRVDTSAILLNIRQYIPNYDAVVSKRLQFHTVL